MGQTKDHPGNKQVVYTTDGQYGVGNYHKIIGEPQNHHRKTVITYLKIAIEGSNLQSGGNSKRAHKEVGTIIMRTIKMKRNTR